MNARNHCVTKDLTPVSPKTLDPVIRMSLFRTPPEHPKLIRMFEQIDPPLEQIDPHVEQIDPPLEQSDPPLEQIDPHDPPLEQI